MYKVVKINNEKVTPIKVPKINPDEIKGYEIFPEIYANIFICAKKKSGKTNVVFKIIKSCINKETKVVVFCATFMKDDNWIAIKKWLDKKKITNDFHSSIKDEKDGVDLLDVYIEFMQKSKEDLEQNQEKKKESVIKCDDNSKWVKVKIKKPKKRAPEYLFILDDISTELKYPSIAKLIKTNRHYRIKLIISSQYVNDLKPGSRQQIDYWLLFKNHSDEKLKEIYHGACINIPFENFYKIYKDVTNDKGYNFLYIDTNNQEFRKNFDEKIKLSNI